jgi:hypothetical protein
MFGQDESSFGYESAAVRGAGAAAAGFAPKLGSAAHAADDQLDSPHAAKIQAHNKQIRLDSSVIFYFIHSGCSVAVSSLLQQLVLRSRRQWSRNFYCGLCSGNL